MSVLGLNLQGTLGNSMGENWSSGSSQGASASYGYSNSIGENWSNSWHDEYGESWGRTYGREASAQDVLNAAVANEVQKDLWSMQAAYNSKEAQKNRDYQTFMSNTSYQRAVMDLLAAGLNPILAAGNMGASTPVGATASSGLANSAKANAHAEQESGSYYSASGGSSSYGYNKSNSYNWSKSYNTSQSASYGYEMSKTTNNVAAGLKTAAGVANNVAGALKDIYKNGAPKIASLFNKASNNVSNTYRNSTKTGAYRNTFNPW